MDNQSFSQCPRAAQQPAFAVPELLTFADVEAAAAPSSSLTCIAAWVRNYLAQPHPDLGRQGLVCPFVPNSVRTGNIWMAEIANPELCFESISAIIMAYRDRFLAQEPVDGPLSLQKAIIVVFPTLAASGAEGAGLVDKVQFALKHQFVAQGLMLGEFHSENESPGLRNEHFRPLRSPIPLLAIRHMVDSDLPFMVSEVYSAAERANFLRAYLLRLGASMKPSKFEQILERLISEEVALRFAAATPAPAGVPVGAMAHATQDAAQQSSGVQP